MQRDGCMCSVYNRSLFNKQTGIASGTVTFYLWVSYVSEVTVHLVAFLRFLSCVGSSGVGVRLKVGDKY